mmetsp:Transcript_42329/g.136144  ORF Transcript_42329/g.136144 Transcript_42329/m.136144 type:complete len:223 (+) Transcript_42329:464-1132(+)
MRPPKKKRCSRPAERSASPVEREPRVGDQTDQLRRSSQDGTSMVDGVKGRTMSLPTWKQLTHRSATSPRGVRASASPLWVSWTHARVREAGLISGSSQRRFRLEWLWRAAAARAGAARRPGEVVRSILSKTSPGPRSERSIAKWRASPRDTDAFHAGYIWRAQWSLSTSCAPELGPISQKKSAAAGSAARSGWRSICSESSKSNHDSKEVSPARSSGGRSYT